MKMKKGREKFDSIEFLKKIGMLIPFDKKLNLYHGRASKKEEFKKWKVQKGYNSKNMNVYFDISVLSTGCLKTAESFSLASVKRNAETVSDIYRIVTYAPNALFFNNDFDIAKLSDEEQKQLRKAIGNLLPKYSFSSISEMVPVQFEDKEWYIKAFNHLFGKALSNQYITYDMIDEYCKQEGGILNKETLTQIAGCINTRTLMTKDLNEMIEIFVFEQNKILKKNKFIKKDGKNIEIPINMDFIASWAKNNDIIGTKKIVSSGTLGKKIEGFYIFDLDKVVTEQTLKDMEKEKNRLFGELSKHLSKFSYLDIEKKLIDSTPQESIEYLKNFNEFKKLLDGDSGVFEEFTVGEHTETVLRIFEDSFKDDLPQNLLPFIKLVILSHDIGKANFAKNRYSELDQKYYNKLACEELMETLKIEPKVRKLIQFIIGDSQNYTNDYFIKKIPSAKEELTKECENILEDIGLNPDKNMVEGLQKMCTILQTCDGGAYTRYAITRDQEKDFYYTNWNYKYTLSFTKPKDFRHREIKFPEEENE